MTRREEIATALTDEFGTDLNAANNVWSVADALLPSVDRLCAEAATEALTDAAGDWSDRSKSADYANDEVADFLRDRAAALTETKETDRG
jgi:hypothetical protein